MARGKIVVAKNYKDSKCGTYRVKRVRCGSVFYGEIREYKQKLDGRTVRIYWAVRLKGEYVQKHQAWAFDKLMFDKFSSEGAMITHVGVLVTTDTKRRSYLREKIAEMWLIKREDFFKQVMRDADGKLLARDHADKEASPSKRESNQYLVPMTAFKSLIKPVSEEDRMKEMRIGRYKVTPLPVSHA